MTKAEAVHLGRDAEHTYGVSGNPDIVKELLEMKKGKKKSPEKADQQLAREVADLKKEIAELKELLKGTDSKERTPDTTNLAEKGEKQELGKQQEALAEQIDPYSTMEAKFLGRVFNRGDIISYRSDSDNEAPYYVLCNSLGDPPGLVLQSVENTSLVFSIGDETDPSQITGGRTPSEGGPGEGGPGGRGPGEGGPGEGGPGEGGPGGGGPGGGGPGEGGPGGGGPGEVDPTVPRPPDMGPKHEYDASVERFNLKGVELDAAIKAYAIAKVGAEKMFVGDERKENFATQEAKLQEVFNDWSEHVVQKYVAEKNLILEYSTQGTENMRQWHDEISRLENLRGTEGAPDNLEDQINNANKQFDLLEEYLADNRERLRMLDARQAADVNHVLMAVRAAVDNEMSAERQRQHPRLEKFKKFLGKHKSARIAAGVGVAVAGFAGTAIGFAPLTVASIGAGATLRGLGGYGAVRGGAEWLAKRRFDQADYDTIEEYLEASRNESTTVRKSKKIGAAAGVGLAAIPIIGKALAGHEAAPTGPKPVPPENPGPGEALNSREFAEMVHHPETFKNFLKASEQMRQELMSKGLTEAQANQQIMDNLARLGQAPEGFGS